MAPQVRALSITVVCLLIGIIAVAQSQSPEPKDKDQVGKTTPSDPKSQNPVPKSSDTSPKSAEPAPKSTEPATKPVEPTPKGGETATDPKTPAAKTPDQPQNQPSLVLKLEQGKPFYEDLTTTISQKLKVQGQDISQTQEQTFTFEWTPEKNEGNKWILKMKVKRVKMKIDISNNPIEYDSQNTSTTSTTVTPGLTDFFKNLEGSEFTVTFNSKDNKVEKVEGREAFIKRLSSGNSQLEGLLRKIITEEAERQMTDPTFGLLPSAPLTDSGNWETKSTLNLGPIGSYEVVNKFTLKPKEKDKDELVIEVVPTLTYKLPSDSSEGLLFKIKAGDIKSEPGQVGTIRFDTKTGRITEAKIPLKLSGNLDVTIGGTDTKIELRQEQTTTIKMSDSNPLTSASTPTIPEKK